MRVKGTRKFLEKRNCVTTITPEAYVIEHECTHIDFNAEHYIIAASLCLIFGEVIGALKVIEFLNG